MPKGGKRNDKKGVHIQFCNRVGTILNQFHKLCPGYASDNPPVIKHTIPLRESMDCGRRTVNVYLY